jgi:hypothetical protein
MVWVVVDGVGGGRGWKGVGKGLHHATVVGIVGGVRGVVGG